MEAKIEKLIAEVIRSSRRWYFNLEEAYPLSREIISALEKQGYKIVKSEYAN